METREPFRARLALNSCPLSWVNTKKYAHTKQQSHRAQRHNKQKSDWVLEVDLIFERVGSAREEHDDHEGGRGIPVTSIQVAVFFLCLNPLLTLTKNEYPRPPPITENPVVYIELLF